LLGVAVEFERRRGRGAQSKTALAVTTAGAASLRRGWRSLDELPPFKTTVQTDATRKDHTATIRPTSFRRRSILSGLRTTAAVLLLRGGRPTPYLGMSPAWISNPNCS